MNILITGATGGIGKSVLRQLYGRTGNKHRFVVTGRYPEKLKALAREIGNDSLPWCTCDLTYETHRLIEYCLKNHGHIDTIIHCAGVFHPKELSEESTFSFEHDYSLHVTSLFELVKVFSPVMVENNKGSIIAVGSSSAYKGVNNSTSYCASKHGLLGFMRALHEELKEHNVRVCCVSPASTQTDMAKVSTEQDFSTFLKPQDVAKVIVNIINLDGNMCIPEIELKRMEMR